MALKNWKSLQKLCQIYLHAQPYKAAWLENNRTLWRHNYIQSFLVIADFDFTFLWKITIKTSNHAYSCDQQVKIYRNQRVVLTFTSVEFITVFPTLTGSLWRRTLICNPLSKKCWENSHAEFRENRVKTVAVTVLPFFQIKMAAVTSAIMIMSQNSNDRYLHL